MSNSEVNLSDAALVLVLAAMKQHIDLNLLEIDATSLVMDNGRSAVHSADTNEVQGIIRQVIAEARTR